MPTIHFPHREGICSRQAHVDLPENSYEREVSRQGFYGPATHMHHKHAPTGWSGWEGELRPRAFDLTKINSVKDSPWQASTVLQNAHCCYRVWTCNHSMPHLARNADGDDLLFIHLGEASLYCDYGHLTIHEGDYIVIPRGTQWRLEVNSPVTMLMIEATDDQYELPDKGVVGQHAVFDPTALDIPEIDAAFIAQQDEQEWLVEIKRHNKITRVTYPYNPLDALGWHGDVSVVKINWRDIRPLTSHRYHLPPSAHTTFIASRFVICTFVPRPIESDPGALKVPFYHNNDDYDEIIFYHQGEFFSRDNISPGMVTFHPCGFTHGPHPKAFAAGKQAQKTFTEEVAVMVDTRDAMQFSVLAEAVELKDYVNSWQDKSGE